MVEVASLWVLTFAFLLMGYLSISMMIDEYETAIKIVSIMFMGYSVISLSVIFIMLILES